MDANPDRTLSVCVPPTGTQIFAISLSGSRRIGATRRGACCLTFALLLTGVFLSAGTCEAASFRTRNFIVDAPSPQLAKTVGEAAEQYRDELAMYWTGETLPPWPRPCPVRVVAGPNLAAQGVTTYNPAPVRDFQMEVIGTPERILDSVLPHEVTHTVLATHFGRPLPRWADEGICTTVEHISERAKHEAKLREFLASRRGIAMNRLFLLTEYPPDVLPMYAQGYSVCRFLIEQQGAREFIAFLEDYMRHPSWTANVQKHYGYDSLAELQQYWLSWVEAGSGPVAQFAKKEIRGADAIGTSLASHDIITRDPIAPAGRGDLAARDLAPRDLAPRGVAPRDVAPRGVAPATALAAASYSQQHRGEDRERSLVAANDRGRASESESGNGWYHRRAEGLQPTRDPTASSAEVLPPGERVAAADSRSGQPQRAGRAGPTWAPPSVMSSGRYSAATPQPETSGSMRAGSAVRDSRRDTNRNSTWR